MSITKTLDKAETGEKGKVVKVNGDGKLRRRLLDMGITPSVEIFLRKKAPFGDPIEINLRGYELSLRKSEAELIQIEID